MADSKPDDSVKSLVDKFGMSEILGHIFPGLIAICALLIWLPVDWLTVFEKEQVVFGVLILIVGYALGLVLSMSSRLGAEWFRTSYRPRIAASPGVLRYTTLLGKWTLLRLTVGLRKPKALQQTQSAYLDIQQNLQSIFGVPSMALLQRQDDQLEMLRAIASDRLKDLCAGTVAQAEILHQRLVFSLGAALAFLILAGSAAARLTIAKILNPGWANSKLLAVLGMGGFFVSWLLRRVAAHLSERELVFTLVLLR